MNWNCVGSSEDVDIHLKVVEENESIPNCFTSSAYYLYQPPAEALFGIVLLANLPTRDDAVCADSNQ